VKSSALDFLSVNAAQYATRRCISKPWKNFRENFQCLEKTVAPVSNVWEMWCGGCVRS
jgi:hypothetical protein